MKVPVLILAAVFAAPLGAQPPRNPVKWSFAKPPTKAWKPGEPVTLRLEASIDSGWHLYALDEPDGGPIATEIAIDGNSPFELGAIQASKAIQIFDPNFNMRVQFYSAKASFQLPVTLSAGAHSGTAALVVSARYQSCNDRICLPPKKVQVSLPVRIAEKP